MDDICKIEKEMDADDSEAIARETSSHRLQENTVSFWVPFSFIPSFRFPHS